MLCTALEPRLFGNMNFHLISCFIWVYFNSNESIIRFSLLWKDVRPGNSVVMSRTVMDVLVSYKSTKICGENSNPASLIQESTESILEVAVTLEVCIITGSIMTNTILDTSERWEWEISIWIATTSSAHFLIWINCGVWLDRRTVNVPKRTHQRSPSSTLFNL